MEITTQAINSHGNIVAKLKYSSGYLDKPNPYHSDITKVTKLSDPYLCELRFSVDNGPVILLNDPLLKVKISSVGSLQLGESVTVRGVQFRFLVSYVTLWVSNKLFGVMPLYTEIYPKHFMVVRDFHQLVDDRLDFEKRMPMRMDLQCPSAQLSFGKLMPGMDKYPNLNFSVIACFDWYTSFEPPVKEPICFDELRKEFNEL